MADDPTPHWQPLAALPLIASLIDGELADGQVENVYRLQLMNTREQPMMITIRAEGIAALEVHGIDQPLLLAPATTRMVPLTLRADPASAQKGSNRIVFRIEGRFEHSGEIHTIFEKAAYFKP